MMDIESNMRILLTAIAFPDANALDVTIKDGKVIRVMVSNVLAKLQAFLADDDYTRWWHDNEVVEKTKYGLHIEFFNTTPMFLEQIHACNTKGRTYAFGTNLKIQAWLTNSDWKLLEEGPLYKTYYKDTEW